jgi:hypothetical protein
VRDNMALAYENDNNEQTNNDSRTEVRWSEGETLTVEMEVSGK